jgi:hypothetical protein
MKSRHVEIRDAIDGVDVIVDDYEVFDYLEDFLTDCGLEFEFTREEKREGQRFYVMHFGLNVAAGHIEKDLDGVSVGEIERLWKGNN